MSKDSKENATIGGLYENILAAGIVTTGIEEAHPVDGDAGSLARDAINQLKEDIHNWVETGATEEELREVLDRIHEIENPEPPSGTGATLRVHGAEGPYEDLPPEQQM